MEWVGEPETGHGVVERGFTVSCDGRTVPGVVWMPDGATGARPLVLIGHGGSLHKRTGYVLSLARRLVRHHGMAAAAIDGPAHGDRAEEGVDFMMAWGRPNVVDDMIADWKATLGALQQLDGVGAGPLGYWGLSMGTILGLPLVAAEPQVKVAVLGLMGVIGPTADRLEKDARSLSLPVLFLQQWDDELMRREDALALFDAIGSADKRLHVNPGAHSKVPPEEMDASEAFLAKHLLG